MLCLMGYVQCTFRSSWHCDTAYIDIEENWFYDWVFSDHGKRKKAVLGGDI
jgi:hypothetical protein